MPLFDQKWGFFQKSPIGGFKKPLFENQQCPFFGKLGILKKGGGCGFQAHDEAATQVNNA